MLCCQFKPSIFATTAVLSLLISSLIADRSDAQTFAETQAYRILDKTIQRSDNGEIETGYFAVPENPQHPGGKIIKLRYKILRSKNPNPKPDPFFFFAGGPGQAVATLAPVFRNHWARADRDIVLINQRGTAGDNHLAFKYETTGNTLQQYLSPLMAEATVLRNRDRLAKSFDLSQYSTAIACDDVNAFRKAMGYDRINIAGGSYGTRFCLVLIRRHSKHIRSAILSGCAPLEFRNPLYHAEGAQRALELIFQEIENDDEYQAAFGNIRQKFEETLARFEDGPISVSIRNAQTGRNESVQLTRESFVAGVRIQMYYMNQSRQLPLRLLEAHRGDFGSFVASALRQNIGLRQSLALGMLLSVTAAEDVARIAPNEVDEKTRGSFFGSNRVRNQIRAAKLWPQSKLPDSFGEPVQSGVPTLIFSGILDPVTPPKWGEMIHQNFPNSRHLIVPAAHDIGGPCVDQIRKQFIDTGSVENLDTQCLEQMQLPRLALPKR